MSVELVGRGTRDQNRRRPKRRRPEPRPPGMLREYLEVGYPLPFRRGSSEIPRAKPLGETPTVLDSYRNAMDES